MISHEQVLDWDPLAGRRAAAGFTEGLDAWLGADAHPVAGPRPGVVAGAADWSAPSCAVELAYDTAAQGLPSGVRAVVQEGSRRLMFETREYEILLRVASNRLAERHDLLGQVLFGGLPLPGATVRLDADSQRPTILTDQTGTFRLPPLSRGEYGLSIAVDGAVLVVPPIALA
jgi:hypothetical protein